MEVCVGILLKGDKFHLQFEKTPLISLGCKLQSWPKRPWHTCEHQLVKWEVIFQFSKPPSFIAMVEQQAFFE